MGISKMSINNGKALECRSSFLVLFSINTSSLNIKLSPDFALTLDLVLSPHHLAQYPNKPKMYMQADKNNATGVKAIITNKIEGGSSGTDFTLKSEKNAVTNLTVWVDKGAGS
jgi:hypothetical protein